MEIDSYLGNSRKFASAIGEFAHRYADQNERDHAQLVQAIVDGKVPSDGG